MLHTSLTGFSNDSSLPRTPREREPCNQRVYFGAAQSLKSYWTTSNETQTCLERQSHRVDALSVVKMGSAHRLPGRLRPTSTPTSYQGLDWLEVHAKRQAKAGTSHRLSRSTSGFGNETRPLGGARDVNEKEEMIVACNLWSITHVSTVKRVIVWPILVMYE